MRSETPDRLPASRSEFVEMVEASPYAHVLRDETRLRKPIVDALKQSDDPITREIGEGLAGGTLSWSVVATTSAYSDFLERSRAALREFDFTTLTETLRAADHKPEPSNRHVDIEEDVWQGLRRR